MRSLPRLFAAALAVAMTAGLSLQATPAHPDGRFGEGSNRRGHDRIVIGHRGASGDRPEHTLEMTEVPLLELGIDGYCTDHPGIGSAALDAFGENR